MKIRIFALARDLGLDSKVLIDICEQAGVKLRNALATISEEERDQIVAFIKKGESGGQVEPPPGLAAPTREPAIDMGKVRPIKSMPARPQQTNRQEQETVEVEEVESKKPVAQESESEAEASVVPEVVEVETPNPAVTEDVS